mgnify:CR=1 FL=1
MYASRDILCRRETLKVPLLSPIGTGAPHGAATGDVVQRPCPVRYLAAALCG